jgi:hypothetical protein
VGVREPGCLSEIEGILILQKNPLIFTTVLTFHRICEPQCCGFGSGIQCFFTLWIRDPDLGRTLPLGTLPFLYPVSGRIPNWSAGYPVRPDTGYPVRPDTGYPANVLLV